MSELPLPKNHARCSCGKVIVWAQLPDGKRIPLDPAPACYMFRTSDVTSGQVVRTDRHVMVNHFATCPDAGKHHKPKAVV